MSRIIYVVLSSRDGVLVGVATELEEAKKLCESKSYHCHYRKFVYESMTGEYKERI